MENDTDMVADIVSKLVAMEYVKSKSEFVRLIKQGGVQINGEKISEEDMGKVLNADDVIKIGKKKFVRVKVN